MRFNVALAIVAPLGIRLAHAVAADSIERAPPLPDITRDVVVIGGGSSGAYAAVKLRRMNKTVAVVEKQATFGGHTSTYHVPGTNITIDYGVQGFTNEDIVRDYFESWDIPVENVRLSETGFGTPDYVDFRNGQTITSFNFSGDLSGYAAQSAKYPYLHYSTRLPNPVPKDLLLSFGQFLKKYHLENETYNLFYNAEGLGDLLSVTTLYVMRYINQEYLEILDPNGQGSIVTSRRNNHEVYEKTQAYLGEDALVNSTVLATRRNDQGVEVIISTPNGRRTIHAKQLLITIPPLLRNMYPFGLDRNERSIFRSFQGTGWYVGLVQASGLPNGSSYQNTRPDTPQNLPQLPGLYQMSPTQVSDIHLVRYGSEVDRPEALVRRDMLATFDRVRAVAVSEQAGSLKPAKLLTYASHYPFGLHVPPDQIAAGFYSRLDDLQGNRNTWYTGAAFISHSTGALWNFTDNIVSQMVEQQS